MVMKGCTYKDEAEADILSILERDRPMNTLAVTRLAKLMYPQIHHRTVKRVLHSLWMKGRVKRLPAGKRIFTWMR